MFPRVFLSPPKHSFFLFGARGTGKSSWLKTTFRKEDCWYLDLLDPEIEDRFRRSPKSLELEYLSKKNKPKWILVDEVQRAPKLLDLIHRMIENEKVKFALSGSSARKLRRGASNLLAGRAFVNYLFPMTSFELADEFQLQEVLNWGSLPKIFSLEPAERQKYLRSYALVYLNEEIRAEQVVRKLEPFRDFLAVAAQQNGKVINHHRIAKEVGTDNKVIKSYFQILEDTWMGFYIPAYHASIRKAQRQQPKFFFFDLGVKRALEETLDMIPKPGTSYYGDCFEHFVTLEIFRLNAYLEKDFRISYLMTQNSAAEIDLVLSKGRRAPITIEIKSTSRIDEVEVRTLKRIAKDTGASQIYYLSQDTTSQIIDGVRCLPWKRGLEEVFGL